MHNQGVNSVEPSEARREAAVVDHVSFVVPARNEERHLAACLESIGLQHRDGAEIDVVVVDNRSTDATVSIAMRWGARVVAVEPGNPGRARNLGASTSDANYLAFVDADCVLPPGWLRRGLEHLAEPGIVSVGSVQAEPPRGAPWVERAWVTAITPRREHDWEPVEWLAAFNLLVRRGDFDAIGGFDESLSTCEDSDLGYRLSTRGELRRDFQFPVRHLGESRSLGEFFRREMWRSRGNFSSARKRGSWREEFASLFTPLAYWGIWLLAAVGLAGGLLWGGVWWVVFAGAGGSVVVMPLAITVLKFGRTRFALVAVLVGVYLLARGLGPLFPAPRVSRADSAGNRENAIAASRQAGNRE